MKSLLCAIAKNEERYINEWVNYHYNLGFDKIVIYNNNDSRDLVIPNVEIIDYKNKHIIVPNKIDIWKQTYRNGIQEQAYNECYLNNSEYDWIAYLDIDEFLVIDNNLSINEFLSQDKFKDVDAIQINWEMYGDNDLLYYEDKPVLERFTQPSKINKSPYVKTIVRTNNPNFITLRVHYADITGGRFVYPDGTETKSKIVQHPNYTGARIKHFYTKTIEEWINRKYKATCADGLDYLNNIYRRLQEFFIYNTYTEEKFKIIKNLIPDLDDRLFNVWVAGSR